MSHLSHKIPWNVLSECLKSPDASSIYLPVGECGCIQINKKSNELQVHNRKHLKNQQTCKSDDCKIVKRQRFDKKPLKPPRINCPRPELWNKEIKPKFKHFCKRFFSTVVEFAETVEKRTKFEIVNTEMNEITNKSYWNDNETTVISLFLNRNIQQLINLHNEKKINVLDVLQTNYGGQAVGNGFGFLIIYHLLPFYLTANMILYLNSQNDSDKWGFLNPDGYFFKELQYDCDFLTFIPCLRGYLKEDVFMKNDGEMHELLKRVFEYIYCYFYICKKLGYVSDYEHFYNDVEWTVRYVFNLYVDTDDDFV